jgi:hypothetical protein
MLEGIFMFASADLSSPHSANADVARGGTFADCCTGPIKAQLLGVVVLKLNSIPHNTAHLPAILFHVYSTDGRGCACTEGE